MREAYQLSNSELISLHNSQMEVDEDMAREFGESIEIEWQDLDAELCHRVETTDLKWPY